MKKFGFIKGVLIFCFFLFSITFVNAEELSVGISQVYDGDKSGLGEVTEEEQVFSFHYTSGSLSINNYNIDSNGKKYCLFVDASDNYKIYCDYGEVNYSFTHDFSLNELYPVSFGFMPEEFYTLNSSLSNEKIINNFEKSSDFQGFKQKLFFRLRNLEANISSILDGDDYIENIDFNSVEEPNISVSSNHITINTSSYNVDSDGKKYCIFFDSGDSNSHIFCQEGKISFDVFHDFSKAVDDDTYYSVKIGFISEELYSNYLKKYSEGDEIDELEIINKFEESDDFEGFEQRLWFRYKKLGIDINQVYNGEKSLGNVFEKNQIFTLHSDSYEDELFDFNYKAKIDFFNYNFDSNNKKYCLFVDASDNYKIYCDYGTVSYSFTHDFSDGQRYSVSFGFMPEEFYTSNSSLSNEDIIHNFEESSDFNDFENTLFFRAQALELNIEDIYDNGNEITNIDFSVDGQLVPVSSNNINILFNNYNVEYDGKEYCLYIDSFENPELYCTAGNNSYSFTHDFLKDYLNDTNYEIGFGFVPKSFANSFVGKTSKEIIELYKNSDEFDNGFYRTLEFKSAKIDTFDSKIATTPIIKFSKINNNALTISVSGVDNAIGYSIYRSEYKDKGYKLIGNIGLGNDTFVDKSLTYNKTYYYKAIAYNNVSKVISNVIYKKIVPNKVYNFKYYSIGSNNIKLSWDKVSTSGYELYRSTNGKNWTKVTTISNNSTIAYNNTKLLSNKTYYYKVRAYKTISGRKIYGSFSNIIKVKTSPNKPSASVSLKNYNAINIKVNAVIGAKSYQIFRSLDGKTNYELITTISKAGTYTDTNTEIGKIYYYKVRACNSSVGCSGCTSALAIKQLPLAPNVSLKTSKGNVNIIVNKVSGANGYLIYRSTSKNGKYSIISNLTDLTDLTYSDSTIKGKTYYYKVRSYITVNGKNYYSGYSSIKSVTSK